MKTKKAVIIMCCVLVNIAFSQRKKLDKFHNLLKNVEMDQRAPVSHQQGTARPAVVKDKNHPQNATGSYTLTELLNNLGINTDSKSSTMTNIPSFETNHLKAIPDLTVTRLPSADQVNCYQNSLILHCLIGKLKGQAKLVVDSQPINSWLELKDVLTQNFSDSKNEENVNVSMNGACLNLNSS
ncbi:unnamed protein product [Brassicogethes aeneus]|uniref:Uncharacterized protein n=1 Tax=Brassicogethes aeneus TaxID=1431903 RepID=A0A9P0BAD3_BRAAE|nr:unnamed protein product [Brassicogethes aeneus]